MEVKFVDEYLAILAQNKSTGKKKYPEDVEIAFRKRIAQIKQAKGTSDLRAIKSLHFEKLKEKRYLGKYSIRINIAYRLIFIIKKDERLEIMEVEEISNHYS
ncbi:plasmid maintenance system killer protein [Pedobacter petrophilus]|uniref:Plasmid maintenance system killer protein n=1 Tax=Pedobacter petrophilus TaxID=1908241 RepID=A0A7K0G0J3_9SPHI|nr:type II toxin-antitoxin system RelE/ParE family toxin [Pedobacter petrophilus]MRX76940.1 plasmid maintenance system killer protein [Pedobacter petrophilus]